MSQENEKNTPKVKMYGFGGKKSPPVVFRGSAEQETATREYAETLSDKFKPLYQRVTSKKAPISHAVKAQCQHCVGYEDTTIRVRECEAFICPLWKYRPYQVRA